ncbi:chorismate synthase [Granulimonas faecalis]|uniref:Chorismate synthase n=1 Tax=Granulimonas faecalis TaxID=2894155 RepID=A0AAV5B3N2_9ACTN|nr:chorismate synthase [Granulimonas faecalis]GJM55426.1 chorismate synthase [Granulimonas faecalis]
MSSTIGTSVRCTVFGQSHSEAIGCVVEGLPAGFRPDMGRLARFMARRAPGRDPWSTPRREADAPRIVSGLNPDGETCGAPLCAIVANTNTRSSDYEELRRVPRPGHADWPVQVRWEGFQDVAGGGHFSGRLTAPLCVAGGICLQMLEGRGVSVAAHLAEVAGVADEPLVYRLDAPGAEAALRAQMAALADAAFPVLDAEAGEAMRAAVEEARAGLDSVGGVVECVATGLPAGVGSPMFDGVENLLARALFGIPAVKGVEFGSGFRAASMRGSEHNDPYVPGARGPQPAKNDAGGILGGLTTGAPLRVAVAVKPTSSIGRPQRSVDVATGEAAELRVRGRHDPCIAPRAVPVVEAVCALVLMDALVTFSPRDAVWRPGN